MSQILVDEFNLKAKWVETESNTTRENVIQTSKILKKEGIRTIYLVSHFWHLPRAQKLFDKEGINTNLAPMGFIHANQLTPVDFMPSNIGFVRVRKIWHEFVGSIWYAL